VRVLAALLLLLIAPVALAQADFKAEGEKMRKELEAQRDRARKANTPAEWLALAEASRMPPVDIEMYRAELREQVERTYEKSPRMAVFREAASHLDPRALAALSANLRDPEVNAAMIRALRAAKRDDEAAAECRATFAWRTPADVPRVLEACKDCRTAPFSAAPGPATHSVFSQWFAAGGSTPYFHGLQRGIQDTDWLRRVRLHGIRQDMDLVITTNVARREPLGLVIGDPADDLPAVIAASAGIPYVAIAPGRARDPQLSAAPFRPLVAAPGPEARARLLLDAARRNGARRIALVVPEEGGDRAFADALERIAGADAVRVTYPAGRREHREDAKRVAATGANAVALLGPADESADWLPFLGRGLVLGSDELDPAGFHDQARRALEGAILVRARYTPADTLAWDESSAAAWAAGWVVGDALAHGADSPKSLDAALEARATEADAANRWLALPDAIAKVEVLRVRAGRLEILP